LTDPLISVVVPVLDGERYLGAAIDSILAQDHRPLEVVVVDDGSTDGSAALAESYGSPVHVVRQANRGPAAARNLGIEAANGDYLSFLDADDLYRPGKLSTQLRVLASSPETDMCICTAQNFWEPGLEAERDRYTAAGRVLVTHHFATLLAHRSVFERVGPLAESTADYADWFMRATDLGLTAIVIPDVLIDRRMHAASHSHTLDSMEPYFELARSRIEQRRLA
jgi:glycosyltransferase involved in cell wall biosynthesis